MKKLKIKFTRENEVEHELSDFNLSLKHEKIYINNVVEINLGSDTINLIVRDINSEAPKNNNYKSHEIIEE